jgi:large subunit ribosomal protein L15
MNLADVKAFPYVRRRRKRVGRGPSSGHGKTATRGHKGAKARSGYGGRPLYEGGQMPLFRRIPKRGFSNVAFKKVYALVNVDDLNRFAPNSTVNLEKFQEAGLVKRAVDGVKVLGRGELKVSLTVVANSFSGSALEKIKKAGGQATEI